LASVERVVNAMKLLAEALAAATSLGGELMDMPLGQVKAGMLADFLLVDGDPTADVTILQDRAKIPAVMKDGKFHRALAAV
jgi:imidazolonepropionase-like amidohydrolase